MSAPRASWGSPRPCDARAAAHGAGPGTPLYKELALATGWSGRSIRGLVRAPAAFPREVRARYAGRSWQWFTECLREGDPLEAAARYADVSVREIRAIVPDAAPQQEEL